MVSTYTVCTCTYMKWRVRFVLVCSKRFPLHRVPDWVISLQQSILLPSSAPPRAGHLAPPTLEWVRPAGRPTAKRPKRVKRDKKWIPCSLASVSMQQSGPTLGRYRVWTTPVDEWMTVLQLYFSCWSLLCCLPKLQLTVFVPCVRHTSVCVYAIGSEWSV